MEKYSENTVLIIGAGGHAKVIAEIFGEGGVRIAGFVTLDGSNQPFCGQIVYPEDQLPNILLRGIRNIFPAVGDNRLRHILATRAEELGFNIINALDPRSHISRTANLGKGIAIMPGASVNASTTINDFAIINTNASVDHDCFVGTAVHIAPGVTLSGNVRIGNFSTIGTGSSVRENIVVGSSTMVGVGSVVVGDIPDDVTAFGNPARIF